MEGGSSGNASSGGGWQQSETEPEKIDKEGKKIKYEVKLILTNQRLNCTFGPSLYTLV